MVLNKGLFFISLLVLFVGCDEEVNDPIDTVTTRNFKLGFTTWPYDATQQSVDNTYSFINTNADVYTEHIDGKIPWQAWINDTELPLAFVNEINGKVQKRLQTKPLVVSVSLLNLNRDEIAEDYDGSIPHYTHLNDPHIIDAYYKHINYIINALAPDYLIISIEANELLLRAPNKWDSYKLLMQEVMQKVKQEQSGLQISQSISLHNLFNPLNPYEQAYISEIINYINQLDFVAISYYPFLNGASDAITFQKSFDFLHNATNKPIAFTETAHIAENLEIPNLNIFINGNEIEQATYLNTLFENAQSENYMFITWWAHRDFDALWQTFPPSLQDVGKIWRDTGLLTEQGNVREAMRTWNLTKDSNYVE